MNDLHFSYSTLKMLKEASHCWINKQMGIKPEETIYMTQGTEGHGIIQGHIGGITPDPRLFFLKDRFMFVEKRKFDPEMKFEIDINGYKIIGFLDADNPPTKTMGEIKLSGTPWTQKQFIDSFQRKIYAIAKPGYTNAILITGSLNPDMWVKKDFTDPENQKLWKKGELFTYDVPVTDKDREEARKWIIEALTIFENGDFNGGLDENGRCNVFRCPWGKNCHFKQI